MPGNKERYDRKTLHEERMYGFFWYDWLWRFLRPALIVGAAALLIVGLVAGAVNRLGERFWLPVDKNDTTSIAFIVESGSSLTTVAKNLEEQGIIRNGAALRYIMDFQGLSQKVQTGQYNLSRSMQLSEIIERITTGDGNPITAKITIIPGWDVEDIADYLFTMGVAGTRQAVLDACGDSATYGEYYYIADVMATGSVPSRKYLLEGYLAPDTYEIYTTATLDNVLRKLLSQTEVVFSAAFHARAEELNMTMDQALTLASMIEKEGKREDFAKVSAVFHNRLRLGMTLGSDVTIQYATGSEKMALTGSETGVSSPYNTYQNTGLPVGPICSPSKQAVEAALYPDEQFIAEEYLYFCSTSPEEGTLVFNKTLEEHNAAVAIYRPLWEQYDAERGVQ